jgi:hypothetical protein
MVLAKWVIGILYSTIELEAENQYTSPFLKKRHSLFLNNVKV